MPGPNLAESDWSRDRLEEVARRICDPGRVHDALASGTNAGADAIDSILRKARSLDGLPAEDVAALIQIDDPTLRDTVLAAARRIHEAVHGGRVGVSAPVCPSNRCVNDCLYCPLRRSNTRLRRSASGPRELQREIAGLLDEGFRHITLVFGEDRSGVAYVRDMIQAAYGTRSGMRHIQRLELNLNPMAVADLQAIKEAARLGTYHVYQETYDPTAYATLHPDGPKADYAWRLTCHDRAHEAGLSDVGLGVLLGAGDRAFDVVALHGHATYLTDAYGLPPHSITYPRMITAPDAPISAEDARHVSDDDLVYVVAVTRLAFPYCNIVLCTPAVRDTRLRLYSHGISQVSVGSLSYPGVYTAGGDPEAGGALSIGRPRALEDLIYLMCEAGVVPNLCVACYAQRRKPTVFCSSDKTETHMRCAPNALLALKEYLMDYASPDTQNVGARLIQTQLSRLSEDIRALALDLMEEAEAGLRGHML
jgi:2-iminoacetate synthase